MRRVSNRCRDFRQQKRLAADELCRRLYVGLLSMVRLRGGGGEKYSKKSGSLRDTYPIDSGDVSRLLIDRTGPDASGDDINMDR